MKPLRAAAWPGQAALAAPGAMLCAVIALAAVLLAQHVGGPPALHALWLGLCLHPVGRAENAAAGLGLCAGPLLRVGVALLGLRVTFEQVAGLGLPTAGSVLFAVASTLGIGLLGGRLLGLTWRQGVLTGGASAICGASAALAIAAALPRERDSERFVLLVVLGVSVGSTAAMVLYPLLALHLHLDARAAGVFLGGSIHDVAQVIGAATLLGPDTLDAAVLVKTARIALLVPVVAAVACWAGGRRPAGAALPPYLLAFVALVLVGNAVELTPALRQAASAVSTACLLVAIAALGVKTAVQAVFALGWRPLALLVLEALWIAGVMLTAAMRGSGGPA